MSTTICRASQRFPDALSVVLAVLSLFYLCVGVFCLCLFVCLFGVSFIVPMEGVGHEVITFFGIWTVAVAAIILVSYRGCCCCCRSSRGIHPSLRREVQAASSRSNPTPTRAGIDTDCPICISFPEFGCLTNCGHAFCTACFMEYFESRGVR